MSEATRKATTARWLPAAERFRARADIREPGECWPWTGRTANGYGQFNIDGRRVYVHRWAYEQFVGPIPEGLVIDHLCRNRVCCNPAHLEPVTNAENVARGEVAAGTHCNHGHEFTPENTRIKWFANRKRWYRACRECDLILKRKRDRRKKTAADLISDLAATRDADQKAREAKALGRKS